MKRRLLVVVLSGACMALMGCEKDVQEARKPSPGPTFQTKYKPVNEERGARQTRNSPVNLFPRKAAESD